MPKEIRYPKAEAPAQVGEAVVMDSEFWDWGPEAFEAETALHDGPNGGSRTKVDLLERTARFGEAVIRFVKKVPRGPEHPENNRLVDQLVGAATSIGANYCEADDAVSGKDYRNKIGTSRKESKETMFFLRMLAASEDSLATEARVLWREAKELNLIFGAIWRRK